MDLNSRGNRTTHGLWDKTWLLAMLLFFAGFTTVLGQEPPSTTRFMGSTAESAVRENSPPAAPTNLRIVRTVLRSSRRTQVTLQWDPNREGNLVGYGLYYDDDASGPPYVGTGASEGVSPIIIHLSSLENVNSPQVTITGLSDTWETYFVVTAHDAAGFESGYSNEVYYTPPPDTTPPEVTITSPTLNDTHATDTTSLTMGGTASDNVDVTRLTWENNRGGSGETSGTTVWITPPITLYDGENIITVVAFDGAGNTGEDSLTVTCTYSHECPDCSGDQVMLENITLDAGTDCTCNGNVSITIGTEVIIKRGATITIQAPEIHIQAGFHAEDGANVQISKP